MVTQKATQKFTPAKLDEIAPELKAEIKIIGTLYGAISSISEELLSLAGLQVGQNYEEFLTKRLRSALLDYKRREKKVAALASDNKKELWKITQVRVALEFCHSGHVHIDRAWSAFLSSDQVEFVYEACSASVAFGRMRAIYDLYQDDVFPRLGALRTAINGAVKGGFKSGVTRRKLSTLPERAMLIVERDRLISLGKSSRYVSAILAKKYSVTTDYVRKVLKRD